MACLCLLTRRREESPAPEKVVTPLTGKGLKLGVAHWGQVSGFKPKFQVKGHMDPAWFHKGRNKTENLSWFVRAGLVTLG